MYIVTVLMVIAFIEVLHNYKHVTCKVNLMLYIVPLLAYLRKLPSVLCPYDEPAGPQKSSIFLFARVHQRCVLLEHKNLVHGYLLTRTE